jgi:hypothetical protein
LKSLYEYKIAASLHCKNSFFSIPSKGTTTAKVFSYLGSSSLPVSNASTTVPFVPIHSAHYSTFRAPYKEKLLRQESSVFKPFVSSKRTFDEFAAGEDVETQEGCHVAMHGAYLDVTLDMTIASELDSNLQQTIIFQFTQPTRRTTFNSAVARTRRNGRLPRQSHDNQRQSARQRGLAVLEICLAAVVVMDSSKRRMVVLIASQFRSTQSSIGLSTNSFSNPNVLYQGNQSQPDGPSTHSSNDQNLLFQVNQSNQPSSVQHPVLNDEVESNIATPTHGSQLRDEEGQETSADANPNDAQPRSQQILAPSLSLAQARAIRTIFESHHHAKVEDFARGDLSRSKSRCESKTERYLPVVRGNDLQGRLENQNPGSASTAEYSDIEYLIENEDDEQATTAEHCNLQDLSDYELTSSAEHVTRYVQTSEHISSSEGETIYVPEHTKDALKHTDDGSFLPLSSEAKTNLEDDEYIEGLFKDNASSTYSLNHDFTKTGDISSPLINDVAKENVNDSSLTAPVKEVSTKLSEDESTEGSLNNDLSPNGGLNNIPEQTLEIALPPVDDIAKVHRYDGKRSPRQSEEEAVKQQAKADEREKAEKAAQAESEARLAETARVFAEEERAEGLKRQESEAAARAEIVTRSAEAARVAEEKANPEARWLSFMGRSTLTRSSDILKPVTRSWQRKVQHAMTQPLDAELASVSNGTKLSRRDFGTVLEQPYWLNDDVIAAHIQLSVDKALERTRHMPGQIPKVHAFNSFFYKNLSTKGPESIKRWAGRAKIGGKDLKQVDTVFIPVNPKVHWTLLVVSPSKRTIEYFDSLAGKKPSAASNIYTDNVKKWLRQEMGAEYNDSEWTVRIRNDGPQQNNNYDCGVFTITTAKLIVLGYDPVGAYDARVMPAQRLRLVAELMARNWVEGEEDRG